MGQFVQLTQTYAVFDLVVAEFRPLVGQSHCSKKRAVVFLEKQTFGCRRHEKVLEIGKLPKGSIRKSFTNPGI